MHKSNNTQASQTVVLNDTRNALKLLTADREQWENTFLRKSNSALYQILVQCYELYEQMSGGTKAAIEGRKVLTAVCTENNYRFVDSTPLITKVVKCVFGVDRRRVSAYSIVLREAIKQKIAPAHFAKWVDEMGGVEQVRLSKSPTAKTPRQKAELGKQAIEHKPSLATAESASLSQILDADKAGEQCVLLAVQNADGSFSINAVINSQSVTNAALAAYFSQTKKEIQATVEQDYVTDKVNARDDAIELAVAA